MILHAMRTQRRDPGLPVIDERYQVRFRQSAWRRPAPWWLWLIFWILVAPIIALILYVGAIWMVFVIGMAFCCYVLDRGRMPKRRRRRW
jgi:hypothetical protein